MQYFLVFLAGVFLALQQSINGELGNYIPLTHVVLTLVGYLAMFWFFLQAFQLCILGQLLPPVFRLRDRL